MTKTLLSAVFGAAFAALAMTPAAFAADQTVEQFHVENGGCDSCHQGEKASADLAFENEQCQGCHGTLDEMDAVHKPHAGIAQCTDCHNPHEQKVGQKPTCESCHDDGRTAESTLKK